jgi:hypothetical protein
MNSRVAPPFPPNPAFGDVFGNWVWSGSRWVCTNTNGIRIVCQVFPASAPYMPSPGLVTAVVECVGGGAGGGGALSSVPPSFTVEAWSCGGGGGGSGGYSRIALAAGLVAGGVNVTIGAGGAGGPATVQTTGAAGGVTSFGALCVANGGNGGGSNVSGAPSALDPSVGYGGLGGGPGIGDVAVWGNSGGSGGTEVFNPNLANSVVWGGFGGASFFGSSPSGAVDLAQGGGVAGNNGTFGAGGSGAASAVNTRPAVGGVGGSGLCVVTEYCWADVTDPGCGCGPTSGGARVAIGSQGWQGYGYDND